MANSNRFALICLVWYPRALLLFEPYATRAPSRLTGDLAKLANNDCTIISGWSKPALSSLAAWRPTSSTWAPRCVF